MGFQCLAAERLKLKMRQQLNRQIKKDKAEEHKKQEKAVKVIDQCLMPSCPAWLSSPMNSFN